ncbi:MAG: hypothetical protein GY953_10535, partial [bacterium]|nr:hypothetical protein [bacterium]
MRSAAAKRLRWLLLPILLVIPGAAAPGVQAQSASSFDEVGRFYVQSFAPEEYGGHAQNWAVVQDGRGFIYAGNNHGVLEYDGVSWRLIPVSGPGIALS